MIEEYDHVVIKATGIPGVVVDIYEKNGKKIYTVESDEKGVSGGIGEDGSYKLFACLAEEIEKHVS